VGHGAETLGRRSEAAGQVVDSAEKPVDCGCRESLLRTFEWTSDRAGGVETLEEYDPDSGVGRRLKDDLVEGVVSRRLVVYVVELADRGDARVSHFEKGLEGERVQRAGVE
jgi:hypothetical protein